MRELVTECTQEETNKGRTLHDKHCAGTSGGEFLLLRLTTIIREVGKGVRAQTHNVREHKVYLIQKTIHDNHNNLGG